MKLQGKTVSRLAEMICGRDANLGDEYNWPNFPYRTLTKIEEFFENIDVDPNSESNARRKRARDVLLRVNDEASADPALPAEGVLRALRELLDPHNFGGDLSQEAAIVDVNGVLERDRLQVFVDDAGRIQLKSLDHETASADTGPQRRMWTQAEHRAREALAAFLAAGSEDDIIEKVLVPTFSQLRFSRVSVSGHRDKALEFGKDLWMKYRLPTGHTLYFGVQVKRDKLDAAGRTGGQNIAEVLTQVRMMIGHTVFDSELNKSVALDHVFVISGGEITKQAREWLAQNLDKEGTRNVLFVDREEILDLVVGTNVHLPQVYSERGNAPSPTNGPAIGDIDDLPF